jgi:type II restriction enzyme
MRDFREWLNKMKPSISDYGYYVDFNKVIKNVNSIKIELNILNSLIGSKNIEEEFEQIIRDYPKTLRCIPLLLATRAREIYAIDNDGEFSYNFERANYSIEQYKIFMHKTGLFNLLENHILSNLVDYITGVETGLDSNGRKNRGGYLMENLVESYLQENGLILNKTYYKEMKTNRIEENWGINLSTLSNRGKAIKKFDFVVKASDTVYAVEANFFTGGGSKLNETARSYKNIAINAATIIGFDFVWFTDGGGWVSARNNLEESFDVMTHLYNINDMENGIMRKVFV